MVNCLYCVGVDPHLLIVAMMSCIEQMLAYMFQTRLLHIAFIFIHLQAVSIDLQLKAKDITRQKVQL